MSFHIDQQANYWWKDDQVIAKFACLGNIVNPQGKLPCIGVVNMLKTMCNDQGKPISMIGSQQFKSIINIISRKRGTLPTLQLYLLLVSSPLQPHRTPMGWVGGGVETATRCGR